MMGGEMVKSYGSGKISRAVESSGKGLLARHFVEPFCICAASAMSLPRNSGLISAKASSDMVPIAISR